MEASFSLSPRAHLLGLQHTFDTRFITCGLKQGKLQMRGGSIGAHNLFPFGEVESGFLLLHSTQSFGFHNGRSRRFNLKLVPVMREGNWLRLVLATEYGLVLKGTLAA
jgi:hypothetical protein